MEPSDKKIVVYDCTLRDGTQGENIALSVMDKIRIAKRLDQFGVHYIEGGWPGSNPKDIEFFIKAAEQEWKTSRIAAFGSTRHWKNSPKNDPNLKALLEAKTPTVTVFGKSWDFHVYEALGIELEQNLQIIRESIDFLKEAGREVVFDAEHFFDGYKANPDYAEKVLDTAAAAGADWLVLCDTNGGSLPWHVAEAALKLAQRFPALGIHTHNDGDMGVANTLMAVQSGARMVQGTVNGYGERIGNANLNSVIANLELKMGYVCLGRKRLRKLTALANLVSETANVALPNNMPFVGTSAFAHKGGIHVSAVAKDTRTYEHVDPAEVGNARRVLISDLSGKSNLLYKIQELGDVDPERVDLEPLLQEIKRLEHEGYQFEGAEASFQLLVSHFTGNMTLPFSSKGFRVIVDQAADGVFQSEATVKLVVDGVQEHSAADGDGPIHALDRSIKKSLLCFFPELETVHLVDYKVRVLGTNEGTAAKVRVLITSGDGESTWSTVGVSTNVMEASWIAITESLLYKLMFLNPKPIRHPSQSFGTVQ